MKIKIINIIKISSIAIVLYIGKHYLDIALRDDAYQKQVKPSFYDEDLISEYKDKNEISIPDGNYNYYYRHPHGELVRTLWSFNHGMTSVEAYLITNVNTNTFRNSPSYTATAKYGNTGSVITFTSIEGDAGLFPKLGFPVSKVTKDRLWIALSNGDMAYMIKI